MRDQRFLRCAISMADIVVLLMTGIPQHVRADGIAVTVEESKVEMPAQQAIVVWDEEKGHEDLILSVELLGGPEAAWVVPVPALPEVKVASHLWFRQLGRLTEPRIEVRKKYHRVVDGQCVFVVTTEVEKAIGVELISREEVGIYDVSILSADEPGALLDWLNENGYAFPEEGGPILDAYVEEGDWYFVAARVLPGKSGTLWGNVQPLWFAFDAERPIYPMRLTSLVESHHIRVLIYVLADHRMELGGFYTAFAGELSLVPEYGEDAGLVDLLTHRPHYITKLSHGSLLPTRITHDLYFEQAASDETFREVTYRTRYVCPEETKPPPTQVESEHPTNEVESAQVASDAPTERTADQLLEGSGLLVLGVGLALLGLLAGLGLVWRRS